MFEIPPNDGDGQTSPICPAFGWNPSDNQRPAEPARVMFSPSWSPQRNVAQSEQYERLLKTRRSARRASGRSAAQITDPQLDRQCLNSFAQH
jgi:hypothetical protein